MKAVFLSYNQALTDRVNAILDEQGIRGFTRWALTEGRGSVDGEPHYGTHAWPSMNASVMAIVDDEACREAAKMEIVRRYFQAAVDERRTGLHHEYVEHLELLMNQVGVDTNFSPARSAALLKAEATGAPAGAMVLPDGRVVTGKGPGAVFAFAAKLAAALGKSRQEIAAAYAAMFIEL